MWYAMRDIGIGARSSDEVLRDKEHNIHCISSFLHIDLRIDLKLDNLHQVLMPCMTLVLARAPPTTLERQRGVSSAPSTSLNEPPLPTPLNL